MQKRDFGFWSAQIPGWLLLAYLVYAQAIPAFNYQLGVRMGTQEPAEQISAVGAAFFYGFAFADLVIYIPVLAAGLIGLLKEARWGRVVAAAAFGITVYWPVVCMATLVDARGAPGWDIGDETAYWIVLPMIALWGLWALFRQAFSR